MTAREELHESMCGSCCGRYARGECDAVDRVIDAFAHELEEKIRTWARQHLAWGELHGAVLAADLIGPGVDQSRIREAESCN